MVELALILPLVLLILFGITEFGRALSAFLAISHAAREGARLGALGGTDVEIERTVKGCATGLDVQNVLVAVTPPEVERSSGTTVTVRVSYTFQVIVPIISSITGPGMPMSTSLSMRVE
jgi:Flp pilus assembly protein TadG